MTHARLWVWFAVVQAISLLAAVAGWFLLIPFCLAQAWKGKPDQWTFAPINFIYGNRQDGVSGQDAQLVAPVGTQQYMSGTRVPYMPGAWAPWRAYCWSAWRNSADNLKYVFAWKGGLVAPLIKESYSLFGTMRTFRAGWQPENNAGTSVPVLSI